MLSDPLTDHFRLTKTQKPALKKLGIETVGDLLHHLPARYESSADIKQVRNAQHGETATFYGQFSKLELKKSFRTKVPMAEGSFSDGSGTLRIAWFHQPYLAKMLPENTLIRIRGKVTVKHGRKNIANPTAEIAEGMPILDMGAGLFPVYPAASGITSLWFYHAVQKALRSGILDTITEPTPEATLKKYNLPTLKTALVWAHQAQKEKDADAARKRFAFEEVFLIQLARAKERETHMAMQAC